MKKSTTDLLNELNQTSHIDQYLKENGEYIIDQSLSKYLCDIIESKNLSKSDIIKKSDINEIYGYQIFSGKRTPSRNKLLCICIGANFTLEETNETLKVGGFSPLFPKIIRKRMKRSGALWRTAISDTSTVIRLSAE